MNPTPENKPMTPDEQAFWDSAALAVLQRCGAHFIMADESVADRAARLADALLAERRTRKGPRE